MKGFVATACASVLILGVWANAVHSQSSQQELMKTCNAQASSQKLTGDARKSFMSKCLSSKPTATSTPQQEKMKTCNAQASSQKLSGDARKKFMSTCLKG
jgi:psiF repeat-containing protein